MNKLNLINNLRNSDLIAIEKSLLRNWASLTDTETVFVSHSKSEWLQTKYRNLLKYLSPCTIVFTDGSTHNIDILDLYELDEIDRQREDKTIGIENNSALITVILSNDFLKDVYTQSKDMYDFEYRLKCYIDTENNVWSMDNQKKEVRQIPKYDLFSAGNPQRIIEYYGTYKGKRANDKTRMTIYSNVDILTICRQAMQLNFYITNGLPFDNADIINNNVLVTPASACNIQTQQLFK